MIFPVRVVYYFSAKQLRAVFTQNFHFLHEIRRAKSFYNVLTKETSLQSVYHIVSCTA